jgi:PAS domain S-box-containing protein
MKSGLIEVLLVESDLIFAREVRGSLSALKGCRIELRVSENLNDATERLKGHRYDAVLLDLFLSDSSGISTFVNVHSQVSNLPVIILTCRENETLATEAVRQGAQDYLVRSKMDGRNLSRVIRYAIERKRAERRLIAQYAVTSVLAESMNLRVATPKILQAVCESLECEMGALWNVDIQQETLRCVAVWPLPAARIPQFEAITRDCTFPKGVGLPGRIWSVGEPVWIENIVEEENFPRARVATKEGLRSAFGFPVKIDHQIFGIIEFFSREIQQPDQDLLHMMAAIGSQIGQFIVRKQAEDDLAQERNLLRTLIDTLPDAIYVKDTRSRFILGNKSVAEMMGAPRTESLVGKTDFDFYPPDLAEQYYADERAVLESGQPLINREEAVVGPSGRQGWFLTIKTPLRDSQGQIIGLVGTGRNITERRREEEEHRLSEARLQAILDNTTAVIYLKDMLGRYLLVNRQFEELFGVSREQAVGKTDYDLFPREIAEAFQANDRRALEKSPPLEFEEVAPHNGELRTYISIKFPLSDSAGVPYAVCGISTDITERKRTEMELVASSIELAKTNKELAAGEESLRKALTTLQISHEQLKSTQLQLIQAEKMESIGTLAAGVAHEVKNPLQTILMGLAYLSKNTPSGDENMPMVLTDMHDAVRRADAIVRGLLGLSAAKELEIKEEELNAIMEHSLSLVNYELVHSRVAVVRDLTPQLPGVRVDKAKMEQVFINVFMNALQAMPQGGTLTVKTSVRRFEKLPQSSDQTHAHFDIGDLLVIAEVQDTGIGIPEKQLPNLFKPFFSTKPAGVGTGLGLAVTKQIIDLHGGTLDIRPAPGGGVRVTLMLKAENGEGHEQEANPVSG